MSQTPKYFIVEAEALPEIYLKVAEAKRLMEIQRCMDKVEITFAPATDGWTLRVVLRDIGSDLLDMSVFLPTEGECLRVKQQIESDPTSFYSRVLGLLMQE